MYFTLAVRFFNCQIQGGRAFIIFLHLMYILVIVLMKIGEN